MNLHDLLQLSIPTCKITQINAKKIHEKDSNKRSVKAKEAFCVMLADHKAKAAEC